MSPCGLTFRGGYSARGLAAALGQRYDQALQDLNHAMVAHPELLVARLNRGVVYWLMGPAQHKAAIADFTAVLDAPAERRLIEAAFYRGQVYPAAGRLAGGAGGFRPSRRGSPGFSSGISAAGAGAIAERRYDAGVARPGRLPGTRPRRILASRFARACYERGRFLRRLVPEAGAKASALAELAERELRQALEQGYATASVCDELGATLELLGRPSDALAIYTRGLQQQPDDVSLRLKRGWLLALHLREYEQAEADFAGRWPSSRRMPRPLPGWVTSRLAGNPLTMQRSTPCGPSCTAAETI